MTTPHPRIVIIGGVAGGASAAARARRLSESAAIILFERGPDISFANCGLPYHIGGTIAERDNLLVQTPAAMRKRFNIDVRITTEVIAIDRAAHTVTARNLLTGEEYQERYDKLILSPGAEPIRPPLPGIDAPRVLTLRNLADMDAIIAAAAAAHAAPAARAVVIGGGYIGLEMAEALRERALDVTLVELLPQVMGPADPEIAAPLHETIARHGVDLRLSTSVTGFEDAAHGLRVRLSDNAHVDCAFAVLAIGVRPDARLAAAAGIALGPRGGIAVDAGMRTTDPDIFAVGDAVEFPEFVSGEPALIPLAGPANRQGRIAADNALGRSSEYKRTQGTAVCKVFDMTVAMTGLNERVLQRVHRTYESVTVHPNQHAGYYPGARPLTLKVLFDPHNGALLGAQAVGSDGVEKRIDVLATAMRAGMTVFDLEELELCYAPPYGSAKDPVNMAGFVAANALRGDAHICHPADVMPLRPDRFLLDVRTSAEVALGTVPGSVNVPLDDLRARINELPRDKEIIAYCQSGLRSYLACRILAQHGFRCRNMTGGYKTYRAMTGAPIPAAPCAVCETSNGTPTMSTSSVRDADTAPVLVLDACGLQCPGPIMKLREAIARIEPSQRLLVRASDPAFGQDVEAWCHSTGNTLVSLSHPQGMIEALIERTEHERDATHMAEPPSRVKTMVVFSGDLDKALAAFIIANGAAAMGSSVTMFFTFWGLNILRRDAAVPVKKTMLEKMFGWMMPRGARRLALSKMHMAGMGTAMIKHIMRSKNVASLPELIASARAAGVRLVACNMSMDLMGIKPEELIDGVESGGVAMYLDRAEAGRVNLFI